MSVRLRYLAHDLEVPEGQFAIGRSSESQLSLDDPLVSRRHAILVVRGETIEVEDLGSRNGVLVNGVRVAKPTRLVDGDILTVGQQQLTIAGAKQGPALGPGRRGPGAGLVRVADTLVSLEGQADGTGTLEDETRFHVHSQLGMDRPDKRVHALSLVGAVADKALAMGRPEEAARLVRRPMEALVERVRANPDAAELRGGGLITRAADLCLRLAEATRHPDWIHFLFDLYGARGEPLPSEAVDQLYELVRHVRIELRRLQAYVDTLQSAEMPGPAERFLVSRIEGLERVAALK